MQTLTPKERLTRLLRGDSIDRIPVSPRIHEFFVYEFFGRTDIDFMEGVVEVYRHFGMDIIDWNCTPHFAMEDFVVPGPNWSPRTETHTEGATTHHVTTVKTPGGELRRVLSVTQLTPYEKESALTEVPIKTESDFDLMERYLPPVPRIDCSSITIQNKRIGEDGITSPATHGPFNILAYCLRKVDDMLIGIHLNPDFFHRMMEFTLQRLMKYVQQYIDAGGTMMDIGTNVANGKLVGPDFWEEFVLPYENRLADFIQGQGVPCLFHNCGHAASHLPVYHKMHHKLWGYLAPPPHGDTILAEAVKVLPRELILWGGIDQIDFLRQATPDQVRERVREIIDTVKPRGNYILGTTDYLETGTPHENLFALVETGHQYGRYDNA